MLTLEQLTAEFEAGTIDTVLVAFPDMQGRLQGKRLDAGFFLDEVAAHGTEACSYLLAVDVEMNTVDGYQMASWDRGYGDFAMRPTSRRCVGSRGTPGRRWSSATWCGRTARRSRPPRGPSCAPSASGWRAVTCRR